MKTKAICSLLFATLFALPVFAQQKGNGTVNGHQYWTVDSWQTHGIRKYFDETGINDKYLKKVVDYVLLFYSADRTVADCAVKINKYYLFRDIVNAKNTLDLYEIHRILNYGDISYKSQVTEEFIRSVMPNYDPNEFSRLSDYQNELEKTTGIEILNIYIKPDAKGFSSEDFNFYDASMPIAEAYYANRNKKQSPEAAFKLAAKNYAAELKSLQAFAQSIFKTGKPDENTIQQVVKLWLELAYYENMRRTILKNCQVLYAANEKALPACIPVFIHELEAAAGREKNEQSVVGTWSWSWAKPGENLTTHGSVTFKKDGTMTWSEGSYGSFAQNGKSVTLTWKDKNYSDRMTISDDFKIMKGTNNAGWTVQGKR